MSPGKTFVTDCTFTSLLFRTQSSLEECLWHEHNNPSSSVIAYEKETCNAYRLSPSLSFSPLLGMRLCPQGDSHKDRYSFEGNVAVALNKSNYEKCMSQIFKDLNVVHRQFRVQYQVPLKHQKYHRFAFKRVHFQLHGKCSLLSVRSADVAENFSARTAKDNYDKPWKQSARAEVKPPAPSPSKAGEEEGGNGEQMLTTTSNSISHIAPLLAQSTQGSLLPPRTNSQKELPAALAPAPPPPDAIKRTLRPLLPPGSITQEIPLSATPILLELTARIASHLGTLFKRQVSHLVCDFAKNCSDEYVLIEIIGFQFSGYGPDVGSSGRVLSLSPELQYKVEHFYRCRLNGMKFRGHHVGRGRGAVSTPTLAKTAVEESSEESDSDDDSSASSVPLSHDATTALDPKRFSDAITPQTLTCRMCTRKIAPGSIRYLLTSVMLHSTIVHLRSRLPLEELPDFCRDRSVTMKSMQRLDDMASSLCPKKLDATVSDLVTCECCYALYKGESRLMEVEHKMAKFTRTAGTNSVKFDLRGKVAKPLVPSPAPPPVVMEMVPPQPVLIKRLSVSGGNIMTRPLSAPPISSSSPAPSRAKPTPAFSRTSTLTSVQSDLSFLGTVAPTSSPPPLLVEKIRTQESHLRDTFRAKNSPTRTVSKEFYQSASPLRRMQSGVEKSGDKSPKKGTQRMKRSGVSAGDNPPPAEGYPPLTPIPIGRPVTRSDIMSQPLTLGRMMVALHKVTDLPVIFLDAYEDFHVSYVSLGRRREAQCQKNFTFTRNRANRFKNRHLTRTSTNIGRILEGDENTSQTSSSHGTSLCSDPSSGYSDDEEEKTKERVVESAEQSTSAPVTRRSQEEEGEGEEVDMYPITRRTSQAIMKERVLVHKHPQSSVGQSEDTEESEEEQQEEEEEEEEEPEICVGSLDVKYMRMSYFMVPGDATEESNSHFNHFVNKGGRILVILCAKLKTNAVIDERHWVLPDETKSARAKAHRLRKEISAIRREFQSKTLISSAESVAAARTFTYDPREDIYKTTDTGDPLPADAIGYSYISISQFKSNAVKRLDIGAPFTYAIKHLPRERSVPMLRVSQSHSLPHSLSLPLTSVRRWLVSTAPCIRWTTGHYPTPSSSSALRKISLWQSSKTNSRAPLLCPPSGSMWTSRGAANEGILISLQTPTRPPTVATKLSLLGQR
jgi:hypothetical protein